MTSLPALMFCGGELSEDESAILIDEPGHLIFTVAVLSVY
jgi:hypothetical protein